MDTGLKGNSPVTHDEPFNKNRLFSKLILNNKSFTKNNKSAILRLVMKTTDLKQLELDAVNKMIALGVIDQYPELAQLIQRKSSIEKR